MAIGEFLRSIAEGNVENLFLITPVMIILIAGIIFLFSSMNRKMPKIKLKSRSKRKAYENGIDYRKIIKKLSKEKNLEMMMKELAYIISKFFKEELNIKGEKTFEELSEIFRKKKKKDLAEFCEEMGMIHFTKNKVTKSETKGMIKDFSEIVEKYGLKDIGKKRKINALIKGIKKELKSYSLPRMDLKLDEIMKGKGIISSIRKGIKSHEEKTKKIVSAMIKGKKRKRRKTGKNLKKRKRRKVRKKSGTNAFSKILGVVNQRGNLK